MKIATRLLLLSVAALILTVQAQSQPKKAAAASTDIVGTLNNNGHKLAAAVLDIAGVTKHASHPDARYTFLLPTDAAIQAFLKDMGLTVDDLKKRPLLAKQLVAQHTLLRSNVREQEIFDKGETRKARTLASIAGLDDVEFKRSAAGKYTVTDPQGNTANVGKPIHPDSNKTILPIDRVLMGNEYYTSIDGFCKHRSDRISSFCDAVKATGLASALAPSGGLDATVFVPNNKAFAKATAGGKPSNEALTNILKFHVVPGARELPKQWKDGASFPTMLTGQSLKMTYARMPAKGTKTRKLDYAEARVVASDGVPVPVTKANIHIGKAVVNGVSAVLNPNAKPAATSTEKAPKPAAAAAPATAAAPAPKPSGRKLLQRGGGGGGYSWQMQAGATAEQDAASSAIENAVSGNESVAAAANSSRIGAEELSIPGDYNQVENGLNPL